MKVRIVNKSKHDLPQYATIASAGMDLRANLHAPVMLKPLQRTLIPTGLFIELPIGYEAQVRPRSGFAVKHGITVLNTPGTIDADYRGEIKVILVNLSDEAYEITDGERVAQMIISAHVQAEWEEAEVLNETKKRSRRIRPYRAKLIRDFKGEQFMRSRVIIYVLLVVFSFSIPAFAQKKEKKKKKKTTETELTEKDKRDEADLFVKAVSMRELGNLEKAQEMFVMAIQMNPEDAAAHYENARLLQAMGRNEDAMVSGKMAINLDNTNKWYKVLYANLSKATSNYEEYVAVYEELIKQYPNDFNFLSELAFAYFFIGEYQKSVEIYNRIEEQIGINEGLSTQKVQLYDRIGDKEKAVAEYERLINSDPDEPRYYALLAEYCIKNKLDDKAIWAYEKIVELNPDDPYVHISLAEFYKKKGDDEKSFQELKIGLSNVNLDLKTKINLLFAYYSGELSEEQKKMALELSEILKQTHPDDPIADTFYASMLYENGDYENSREIIKNIIKTSPGNYGLWEQLLFCNMYMEDYQALAKDSEDAIDLFPSYPLPYFFAGIGNFQIKDFVKAQAYLDSGKDFVVNNNPLLEQFYSSLGDTYNELEKYDASYKAYDKALQINPDNTVVLNNYAYYLSLRGEQLEKAEKMGKLAVEKDPYNSNNLDTYAWVLYQLEKYDLALEWIKKAYGNGGESSGVVLEHYGDILYRLDRKDEAYDYWKLAKDMKDHSDLLDKKIKDKTLYE